MKNKITIKLIITIIFSYLMMFIINYSLNNTFLAQPELDYTIILNLIFASCIVIIALIVIFGILILNKHK